MDTYKFFLLSAVFNTNVGFTTLAENFEGEMFDIRLDLGIIELASNETFRIEDTAESYG
jgi:hypothetical protein